MARRKKVTEINRTVCRELSEEVVDVLNKALGTRGLSVCRKGGGSFDASTFTFKLEVSTEGGTERKELGNVMDAQVLGLPANIFERQFNSPTPRGKIRLFTVTEINLNRPKYPVTATNENGKLFKFPTRMVLKGLDKKNW